MALREPREGALFQISGRGRAGNMKFGSDGDENQEPPSQAQPQLRFPIDRRFTRKVDDRAGFHRVLTHLAPHSS